MARYTGSSCRICRGKGVKLFLKGTRCHTDKCAYDRRSYPPGPHKKGIKAKPSNYGLQLGEKQKVKKVYGILERQFRRYFELAERSREVTGAKLLQLLERRLDNVLFRACFSLSRGHARQMVRHGLIMVNGRKLDIPSYSVKTGDVVEIKKREKIIKNVKETIDILKDREVVSWLRQDLEGFKVDVVRLPERGDIDKDIQEQLIVELYSK